MNRPAGVIVSAVILVLIGLLQLLGAATSALGGVMVAHKAYAVPVNPGTPEVNQAMMESWMHVFPFLVAGFCAVLAGWAIVTAIGVFQLRRWGRISILVIAGCLSVAGLGGALLALVEMVFVPAILSRTQTQTQVNLPAQSLQLMRGVFGMEALFALLVLGIGVWWLVYFNLRTIRTVFQPPVLLPQPIPPML